MVSHTLLKTLTSLVITCYLLTSTTVQAEIWLTDSLYLENNHQLLIKNLTSNSHSTSTSSLRLLPEFTLTQGIESVFLPPSKITLGTKLDLYKNDNETNTHAIINELNISSSIGPYWAFTLGRQKISYAQPDLFNTSLNKNDLRPEPLEDLNYSQGLLILYRLGFVEQSLMLNQQTESSIKQNPLSAHYQLKLGIPGYKVGPAKIVISYEDKENNEAIIRGMLGGALQFPIVIAPGDWQWAFQYAQEFNNQENEGNQIAWQTSLSWLGFIPRHKIGVLFSHSDALWDYSDDFNAGENGIEIRYQWTAQHNFNIELAANQRRSVLMVETSTEEEISLRINFMF
jgi:hypothetical protein